MFNNMFSYYIAKRHKAYGTFYMVIAGFIDVSDAISFWNQNYSVNQFGYGIYNAKGWEVYPDTGFEAEPLQRSDTPSS